MTSFYFETTCERIRADALIQQPYSFSVNLLTLLFVMASVFFFGRQRDTAYILLVAAIILMEAWHSACHARPTFFRDPRIMVDTVHALFLVVVLALVFFIRTRVGLGVCTPRFWGILIIMGIVDVFLWIHVRGVYMILSGIVIVAYLIGCVARTCPKGYRGLAVLYGLLVVGAVLLCIEKKLCRADAFPMHVVIEGVLGLITLTILHIFVSCTAHS